MERAQKNAISLSTTLIEEELGREKPDFEKREIITAVKALRLNLGNLGILDTQIKKDVAALDVDEIRSIAKAGRRYLSRSDA